MAYSSIIYEVNNNIAYITINRPKVLNALNDTVIDELEEVFTAIKHDDDIKAIIITGGCRAFVSGGDINQIAKLDLLKGKNAAQKAQSTFNLIENLGKPVIAAINGYALGGGCELAMACTLRVASTNAKLGQPEVNLGIIPGYGGTQRLPRLVGKGRALELILTGHIIDAKEALQIGLVNKITEPDNLMREAEDLAKTIINRSPIAIKCAIDAINRGLEVNLEEGLNIEADLFGLCCSTEDKNEGVKAFFQKRKPKFKGK